MLGISAGRLCLAKRRSGIMTQMHLQESWQSQGLPRFQLTQGDRATQL